KTPASGFRLRPASRNERLDSWLSLLSLLELDELDQVAFWIFQRRDPQGAVVLRLLDELDPGGLQSLPLRGDVVGHEADHVPGRIGVASVHLAVRAQRERRRPRLAEQDEGR